jgi:hypothetical protein
LLNREENQEKKPAPVIPKPWPRPGPIADPRAEPTPPAKESPAPTKTTPGVHTGDEIDPSDVVRVSSNLIPIPASVVDAKGIAITGLRLEDFELRIDGN